MDYQVHTKDIWIKAYRKERGLKPKYCHQNFANISFLLPYFSQDYSRKKKAMKKLKNFNLAWVRIVPGYAGTV
jgi:hypothetical protein